MALSTTFELVNKLYSGMLKGAKELVKKEGYTGSEALFFMQTTTGKVLFDITDRQKLDDTLVKVTGDVIQGIILKPLYGVYGIGFAIDIALLKSGNSLGDLLLTLKHANEVSFSQGYIYKPEGLTVQGVYMPGQYFRVGTITGLDGITKIYTDPSTGQFMSAEVITKAMYESVHPDYLDLYKYETMWEEVDNTVKSFNPQHIVSFEKGVLSVTFPDGHIEAKDLENVNNVINGGTKDDDLYGMGGNDVLYGNDGGDYIDGGTGNDVLVGGVGSDGLVGGEGNDTLIGTNGYGGDDGVWDTLNGGDGFDTYVAGNHDVIYDSDQKGLVSFKSTDLSGKKYKNKQSGRYEDGSFYYDESGSSLIVTAIRGGESITIHNWNSTTKKGLGIELSDTKDIDVSITKSASAMEGNSGERSLSFTVTLSRALEDGESLKVSVSSTDEGSYTFTSGEKSHTFTHSWYGDTRDNADHIAILTPTTSYSGPYSGVKVKVLNNGTATVYDDDERRRHDPLALDMDMDGFIDTTALETSGTYFDITGDGLKERVGWISPVDALLTYDKNENAQIDGIDEVFGNLSESGFEELKRTIDSNHDNKIDRRDELFAQLQVWNDLNQDGEAQSGELQSLSEAGITSIDLNYVSTNINVNGNLLVEASKYTDTTGSKELAADIQLATDAKDTKVDINDIPDFTIDPITHLLPQLRGSGLVYDSFIRYNMDPEFKAIAVAMSKDTATIATDFDTFIEHYSGYTAYINQLREKYSQNTFDMVEADKHAWIVERFEATNANTVGIESYYNTSLNRGYVPTTAKTANVTMEMKYRSLADKIESTFAMQSVVNYITGGSVSSTPHTTPTPSAPKVDCPNNPLYSSAGTGGGSSTSPIVLDLNRNSITSISLAASSALFDYDGEEVNCEARETTLGCGIINKTKYQQKAA